jgi:hypothetical protein
MKNRVHISTEAIAKISVSDISDPALHPQLLEMGVSISAGHRNRAAFIDQLTDNGRAKETAAAADQNIFH